MQMVWADSANGGLLPAWVSSELGWDVEITKHPSPRSRVWVSEDYEIDWTRVLTPKGFKVLPRRWAVEIPFGWLGRSRQLSKEYDVLTECSEGWIY